MRYWERLKPFLESIRRELNSPRLGFGVEYLCNEIQKFQDSRAVFYQSFQASFRFCGEVIAEQPLKSQSEVLSIADQNMLVYEQIIS